MISSLVAYDDSDSETETGKAEDPHMSSRKTNPASSAVNHLQCFAPGGLDKKFTCKTQPAENIGSSTASMVRKDCSAYYVQTNKRELTTAYPSKVYPGHTTVFMSYKSCDQASGSLIKSELLSGNSTSSQKRVHKDDVAAISGIRPYIPKRLRQEKSASVSERKESEGQGEKTSDEIKPDRSGEKSSTKISEFIKPYLGSKYKSTEIPKNLVFQIAKHRGPINKVQWCPVQEWSHMLLSASMDSTVKEDRCINVLENKIELSLFKNNVKILKVGFSKEYVKIWDAVDTGRCLKTYSCHSCAVRAAQWSLCGRRILSGGFDFMLHLTDVETGAQVFTSKNEYRISTLKFHPSDPNIFICGGFGPEVKAWDIRNCKVIKVYKAAVQQTLDVLFLPEGKEFLTSTDAVSRDSADRTIIAWDFHSAAKISNQIFHERYTCPSLTLHPKESTFVAQTNGNYMALFSTQRPYRINKKKRYEGHKVEGFAVDCEFSPDGALLLTGSSEGKVFFYNYHTARIIHTLSAHDQACVSATFHPVLPSLLATCDWAGEIKVWQ